MPTTPRLLPPRHRAARRGRARLFVLPGALLLFFLRFGYDYGTSDQDEVVPFLLHRLDPALFAQDWFVATQTAGYGIRTVFVTLLQGLALWMPTWLAVLLLYIAVWLALAGAVYVLSRQITGDRLAAALTVVAALVLTPQWTLGGNDMATRMLVPSMAAWALGLWGVQRFLHERYVGAGLLVGAAAAVQALVGLQLAGLLGLVLLLTRQPLPAVQRARLVRFSGSFLLLAVPALAPLVLQQLGGGAAAEVEGASVFYVMAAFRNPHHYLPLSFPATSYLKLALLAGLGVIGFQLLRRRHQLRHALFLVQIFGLVAAFVVVGFVFTEAVPVLFVAKLQLFKMTVLAKLLLVVLVCGAFAQGLPEVYLRPARRLMERWRLGVVLVAAAWLVVLGGVLLSAPVLRERARPLVRPDTPLGAVEAWARTETPREAVFAVPPSWSGFRSHAERAIVIDFKAFPYRPEHLPEWFARLRAAAPLPLPERGSPGLQAALDDAFLHLSPEALYRLAGRYDADFVIRHRSAPLSGSDFELVFGEGPWLVYRVLAGQPGLT